MNKTCICQYRYVIIKKFPLSAGGINAAIEFISFVIAASGLNEFAIIQITGKRKNNDITIITAAIIQLIVFCFLVSMFFSLLIFGQNSLYDCKYHDKECKYYSHRGRKTDFPVYRTCFINVIYHCIC